MAVLSTSSWLVYGVFAVVQRWDYAVIFGLALSAFYLAVLSRRGTIKLMDWTSLAYFAFSAAVVLILQMSSYPRYHVVIVWSFFAVPAWGSVIMRRPFTIAYARETTPPEIWHAPEFLRFNVALTLMFALTFTIDAVLSALAIVTNRPLLLGFVLPMTLFIAAVIISREYPERFARSFAAERMVRLAHLIAADRVAAPPNKRSEHLSDMA